VYHHVNNIYMHQILTHHERFQLHNLKNEADQNREVYDLIKPVVPPPGFVSADMIPGKRKQRKSTPYL
jgi:hypothetical protein